MCSLSIHKYKCQRNLARSSQMKFVIPEMVSPVILYCTYMIVIHPYFKFGKDRKSKWKSANSLCSCLSFRRLGYYCVMFN